MAVDNAGQCPEVKTKFDDRKEIIARKIIFAARVKVRAPGLNKYSGKQERWKIKKVALAGLWSPVNDQAGQKTGEHEINVGWEKR